MTPKQTLFMSAVLAATLTAPAAACDLDGLPGVGGFHRMNPFAKSLGGLGPPRPIALPEPILETAEKARDRRLRNQQTRERKKRAEGIETLPASEREVDHSSVSISEEDKATFS